MRKEKKPQRPRQTISIPFEVLVKKTPEFMSPEDVAEFKNSQPTLTPEQQLVSDQATAAIAEIEDIYFGSAIYDAKKGVIRSRPIHSNQLIAWIKELGITAEDLSQRIKAMAPGEIMILKDLAFVKTPTNELQEAGSYINRVEKSLIGAMQRSQNILNEKAAIAAELDAVLAKQGFWQLIRRAFASLF